MLRYLPNALTALRLLLALPLAFLILQQEYAMALWVGLIAGLSDAFDGLAARKLDAQSQFGAMLDPIADKTLVTVTFLSLASVEVVSWAFALFIIARDLVIVGGALCYRLFIGAFEFGARPLSKLNMAIQIAFCVLLLITQITIYIPPALVQTCTWAVIAITLVSGLDYIQAWSRKAVQQKREG